MREGKNVYIFQQHPQHPQHPQHQQHMMQQRNLQPRQYQQLMPGQQQGRMVTVRHTPSGEFQRYQTDEEAKAINSIRELMISEDDPVKIHIIHVFHIHI